MSVETQNIHGLSALLNMLEQLPVEIVDAKGHVSERGSVITKALRKGSVVIVKEAKQNVQRIISEDQSGDKDHAKLTGSLLKNIATVKERHPEKYGASEMYTVKVKRAPKVRNKSPAEYGGEMEYGTSRQHAKPWMTPAFYAKRQEALDTVVEAANEGVSKAIKKVAAMQNWSL